VLTWREKRTAPSWRLRYRFAAKPRVMEIGSYTDLTLAAACQAAKELRAKIALGHDVAGEKQERKSTALSRIEAAPSVTTVGQLTLTLVASEFDDGVMSLPRIKLTLPTDLREYVDRRVLLGGFANAGEYMRQLIRSDAEAQQDGRLRDGLAAHRSGGDSVPGSDSR
jgi:Arc/MetJ-type ribon-helix-helix transcriptional regulator